MRRNAYNEGRVNLEKETKWMKKCEAKLLQPGKLVFTILIPSTDYPECMEKLLQLAVKHWKKWA